MAKGAVVIDFQKCKGCGLCVVNCPTKTLVLSREINAKGFNYAQPNTDGCIGCSMCAQMCPDAVITVYKPKKS